MNKHTLQIKAGDVPRVKKMTVQTGVGQVDLRAPPGRELVVLVLGVSDPGLPFDVDSMLWALGYEKRKEWCG